MDMLEDETGSLTLSDILNNPAEHVFAPADGNFASLGFTPSVYWFRFALDNRTDTSRDLMLLIETPWLNSVTLFEPGVHNKYQSRVMGDEQPFSQREIVHRQFIAELITLPGRHTYYLRIRVEQAFMAPVSIWEPRTLFRANNNLSYYYGMFFGSLALMFFYNLFLFFSLRLKSYLFYCIYLAAFFLMTFSYNGFSYQYLWPESPTWMNWWYTANIFIFQLTGMLFAISFLNTRERHPAMIRFLCLWQ